MKLNKERRTKKDKQSVTGSNEEGGIDQNIADTVNDWISESRENRRAEKSFSDERISAWKTTSPEKLI